MIVLGIGALGVGIVMFLTSDDLMGVTRGYPAWLVVAACILGGLGCLVYGLVAAKRNR